MIRPLSVIFAAAMAFSGDAEQTRWVPDPITHGMTQTYIPDGYDCRERGGATAFDCWPSGGKPTVAARQDRGPAFIDPAPSARAPVPQPPGLSGEARKALSAAVKNLRLAAAEADIVRRGGTKKNLVDATARINQARDQIETAVKEIGNVNEH